MKIRKYWITNDWARYRAQIQRMYQKNGTLIEIQCHNDTKNKEPKWNFKMILHSFDSFLKWRRRQCVRRQWKKFKKFEKKNIIKMKKDLNQELASFLQSRLLSLIEISMRQNVQNQKNVESWNFLDLNSNYSTDLKN